jgi:hypothetical protein
VLGRHALSIVVLVGCAAIPTLADDAPKKDRKEKQVVLGEVIARLTRVEGAQRTLVIQVPQATLAIVGGRLQIQFIPRDVELQITDDIKVRVLQPPPEFDEKGRLRKRTAKELKELRGPDSKLPGFQADFDSLKPDQIVRVTIVGKKETGYKPQRPKAKPKPKADDEDPPEPERPTASMIVILVDPVRQ